MFRACLRNIIVSFIYIFSLSGAYNAEALPLKKLGVVDIESETFDRDDQNHKRLLLDRIRERITSRQIVSVVSSGEIESKLLEKNLLKQETEKQIAEQQKKKLQIEAQIQEGSARYLASHFEEAISSLQNAFAALKEINLVLDPETPAEILKLLAASYFFLGQEQKAKSYLSAVLDLDPVATMNSDRFPPEFIELFNSAKSEDRYPWKIWNVEGSQTNVIAKFLGSPIPVIEEGAGLAIRLPLDHPIFGSQSLLLTKEGFAPMIFPLESLPKHIQFNSIEDRRHPTKGLFAPIGANTPSTELKWFFNQFQVSVLFLGSVVKDPTVGWLIKGQWLEEPTNRASPVVEASSENLASAADRLVDRLMPYLGANGAVLQEESEPVKVESSASPELNESKPFYKTWWFWSLAGVGLAGAGVGTYVLMNPQEKLQFGMKGP